MILIKCLYMGRWLVQLIFLVLEIPFRISGVGSLSFLFFFFKVVQVLFHWFSNSPVNSNSWTLNKLDCVNHMKFDF